MWINDAEAANVGYLNGPILVIGVFAAAAGS
jgi:hypothetical protein